MSRGIDVWLQWQYAIDKARTSVLRVAGGLGGEEDADEFAAYLGVKRSTLSTWLTKKRVPEGEAVRQLALVLGLEVYDWLGLERPDEDLYFLERHWNEFTDSQRRAIREYAGEHLDAKEAKRASRLLKAELAQTRSGSQKDNQADGGRVPPRGR